MRTEKDFEKLTLGSHSIAKKHGCSFPGGTGLPARLPGFPLAVLCLSGNRRRVPSRDGLPKLPVIMHQAQIFNQRAAIAPVEVSSSSLLSEHGRWPHRGDVFRNGPDRSGWRNRIVPCGLRRIACGPRATHTDTRWLGRGPFSPDRTVRDPGAPSPCLRMSGHTSGIARRPKRPAARKR